MSEPAPFPKQADALKLRARPRPVTRINRKVLMIGAGLGVMGLFAAASIALDPPKAVDPADRQELYNTSTKRAPDGLADLPSSYATWTPSPDTPRLGAPLAGDLGGTMVSEEKEWGLDPDWNVAPTEDFRPSLEDEALRAERLVAAKLADAAGKSSVFFDIGAGTSIEPASLPSAELPASLGSELLALAGQGAGGLPTGFDSDENLQARKIAFADEEREGSMYNPRDLETPVSPYQVMAGTLIPASLVTGLNSDLPGTVVGQVTQPVYDTVSGRYLLIPQGARLIGRYQSEVSFGQQRALLVWDRIIFPDGGSVQISEPSADKQGFAGLADRTDHHWSRVFAAAGLATLLGIGSELGSDDDDIERAIRRGFGDSVSEAGSRVVDRNLGIQPTLRIRPGWPVRVIVTRDLVLKPYSDGGR
ncbi:conjugal transfer protein TrbI [Hyphomonas sp. L-53-1-40]|jgi:type IV secretion system protein VirB10|uniref:TrbI/VirB10 family protein n=1 Tax=Henriciella marina TaxID=453851 RepID=A0ABT4LXR2_9PROT|nr:MULTISPECIES: TrbI/VirB10 family protein [Hyphomonadaceae]KCZ63958.1 conjugal transfer protein TrbI [Hyphomonas sp. L-53-1-40]MCZ4299173.1 TrbI/VirB10 family protein [Henriciella marina]